MTMELKKITLGELAGWIESPWFGQLPVKPVSRFRAASYRANPAARADDPVVYYFEESSQVVAFRTVLPAIVEPTGERFAWLSGVWTHPRFRRKGLASRLLHEVCNDWQQRVAAVNFAPLAGLVYRQSGLLQPARELTGKRFYLFLKSKKLLAARLGNLFLLWPLIDFWAAVTAKRRIRNFQPVPDEQLHWERMAFPDRACMELAAARQPAFLFRRGEAELKWILAWPWLSTDDPGDLGRYPFSSYAPQFEGYTVKFFDGSHFAGFLLYSIRDGHLKLLHANLGADAACAAARFLLNEAVTARVEMMTVLNTPIADAIARMNHPFVAVKRWSLSIYSTPFNLPQNSLLQPAEGDFIFT